MGTIKNHNSKSSIHIKETRFGKTTLHKVRSMLFHQIIFSNIKSFVVVGNIRNMGMIRG